MSERLQAGVHGGVRIGAAKGFDVIECEACGFAHVLPLPSVEELETVYRDDYYLTEKPTYLSHAREDEEWLTMSFADRFVQFEELLPSERRRILDVGTGPGYFLATGRDRGWSVQGIEPSRAAAAHARDQLGLDIVEGFLAADTVERLRVCDVVHLSQVLEHVPDPAGLLELAASRLEPGGLLCVSVPNDFSPFQRVLETADGFAPWWIAPPHHLNYFTFDSLERLMTRAGFEPLMRDTNFPMEMFLLMGENYTTDPALGRALHAKRKRFDLSFARAGRDADRRRFYRAMAEAGMGRLAIVTARKKG